MRHTRFDVAALAIEGAALPLRAGYLLVAETDASDQIQWECLAYGIDPAPLAPGRYQLDITALGGRRLQGSAIRVRSVDGAHVLRGDGPLDGARSDELT